MKSYVDSLVHDVLVEELPDVYLSFLLIFLNYKALFICSLAASVLAPDAKFFIIFK